MLEIFGYLYFSCEYKVQMAQKISIALNAIPSGSRDLVEFAFFVVVGITAGSLGMIWMKKLINDNRKE